MSYLDDPQHVWELEPTAQRATAANVRESLDHMQAFNNISEEGLALIVRGAAGLMERSKGTAFECFETAVCWYYG